MEELRNGPVDLRVCHCCFVGQTEGGSIPLKSLQVLVQTFLHPISIDYVYVNAKVTTNAKCEEFLILTHHFFK